MELCLLHARKSLELLSEELWNSLQCTSEDAKEALETCTVWATRFRNLCMLVDSLKPISEAGVRHTAYIKLQQAETIRRSHTPETLDELCKAHPGNIAIPWDSPAKASLTFCNTICFR